jgi:hypothetical protein
VVIRPAVQTRRALTAIVLATLVAVISAPLPLHAAGSPKFSPPKPCYLPLGDSFAYGFQYSKMLERDRFFTRFHAERYAEAVPGATIVVLPDCGHTAMFDHPELVGSTILSFVDTTDQPAE